MNNNDSEINQISQAANSKSNSEQILEEEDEPKIAHLNPFKLDTSSDEEEKSPLKRNVPQPSI